MADSAQAARAREVVMEFIRKSSLSGLKTEHLEAYTSGRFTDKMRPFMEKKPFPDRLGYVARNVQSIRYGDSVAIVGVTSVADTIPLFGPLSVEMTFFVILDSTGWKIVDMRRFQGVEARVEEIRLIDSSNAYPRRLKPIIARELGSTLLSNDQLRENFLKNRARFVDLASRFGGPDSLNMLGRIDRNVQQLNFYAIEWGAAARAIPQDIVDEYLASASPQERTRVRAEMKHHEKLRRIARDSLAKHVRRAGYKLARIDETVEMMYELGVSFVNARLPWTDAVQLTVGGEVDDAIGYLYSPKNELPIVSIDEYYYLEPLGDGWWIFRAG